MDLALVRIFLKLKGLHICENADLHKNFWDFSALCQSVLWINSESELWSSLTPLGVLTSLSTTEISCSSRLGDFIFHIAFSIGEYMKLRILNIQESSFLFRIRSSFRDWPDSLLWSANTTRDTADRDSCRCTTASIRIWGGKPNDNGLSASSWSYNPFT